VAVFRGESGAPAAQASAQVLKRELLGVPIALVDYERAMRVMDQIVERRERGYVCAIAVHALMVSRQDRELRDALLRSSLTVPDGRPLVWALNLLGERLPDRVYGPELMRRYCERAPAAGHRIFLVGGHDDAALVQLQAALERRFPGIAIAGASSPPHRPPTPAEEEELTARIAAARADVVFVGLGAPKQEKWMARMRPRLDVPLLVGVGAAFDFLAGRKRQAPAWMQRHGLEWAFRLAQEPTRLAGRYLRYNPAFVGAFMRQYLSERLRRR
jgi:N-acetylglucosaminyldiphosphoundecaprenol N-acetyl-beta-D-mannosaminyltransferase